MRGGDPAGNLGLRQGGLTLQRAFIGSPGLNQDIKSVHRPRSGGRILVDQLKIHGVDTAFCVPGESYLAVLDALYDLREAIKLVVCRQEGGAAYMADAYGRLTGKPGVCIVTRGPGACNAAIGVHTAFQDSTPLILFVGQVDRAVKEREALQEVDCGAMFGGMAKWTVEIERACRLPELVSRAFQLATAGRPGPVVIGLPSDMLGERFETADAVAAQPVETAPGAAEMDALASLLAEAERPLMVLGGSRWDEQARQAMHGFAERFDMPVATGYRRAPLFDPLHACYAGDLGLAANPKLAARAKAADLILMVGGRMSEITTQGYTLFEARDAPSRLVHVHPAVEELGRIFPPKLAIHATPGRFAAALRQLEPRQPIAWSAHTRAAHGDYLEWSQTPTWQPGEVNLAAIMVWLRENLPSDAILCNGAGNYASWIHRFYRFRRLGSHFAPTSASMGYGVPAAVAMKRLQPQRTVISINGDGDFLMNGQEFAIAVQYDLPIMVLVFDNGIYGTIRMHQERFFPGRESATDLRNPDFAAYARAFGGFGATVEKTREFPAAFAAARASMRPSIIHVRFDPDGIAPNSTLTNIRVQAMADRT